jgi:hypothetical protein
MPRKNNLPHKNVLTRLRPSKVHRGGVGVFAICDIKKNSPIFGDDDDDMVWVYKKNLAGLVKPLRELYDDFAVIKNNGKKYGCPRNFNLLTLSWYLNESKNPNVQCDNNYRFFASRDIKAGEELTVNYSTYSEPQKVKADTPAA